VKLVVITDTGETIEARCDGCRHWRGIGKWTDVCKRIVQDTDGVAFLENGDYASSAPALHTAPSWGCRSFEAKERG
jgi:hypothetical protein